MFSLNLSPIFYIHFSDSVLEVTQPLASSSLVKGSDYDISWKFTSLTTPIVTSNVELWSTNDGIIEVIPIVSDLNTNITYYTWQIPTSLDFGKNYFFRVFGNAVNVNPPVNIGGFSESINIVNPRSATSAGSVITASASSSPSDLVEFNLPNGNSIWSLNQAYDMSWSYTTDAIPTSVTLELWQNVGGSDSKITTIGTNVIPINSQLIGGGFTWNVPANLIPGKEYSIRYYASLPSDGTQILAASEGFAIGSAVITSASVGEALISNLKESRIFLET